MATPVGKVSMQKTILITGASSGLGRALFHAGLKAGHTVVGTVRREEDRAAMQPLSSDGRRSHPGPSARTGPVARWCVRRVALKTMTDCSIRSERRGRRKVASSMVTRVKRLPSFWISSPWTNPLPTCFWEVTRSCSSNRHSGRHWMKSISGESLSLHGFQAILIR